MEDNQYVRRYRQHIPFYKDANPEVESRNRQYWHHLRENCDQGCVWGIPVVIGQFIMFYIEDDVPTDLTMDFTGGNQNSTIQLCCIPDGLTDDDPADCDTFIPIEDQGQTFFVHNLCVRDGQLIQRNYIRFLFDVQACGLYYIKILAYDTEDESLQRVYYSQPIDVIPEQKAIDWKMLRLNMWDECGIGGINWAEGIGDLGFWQNIGATGGQEVWLPREVRSSFIDKVTNEEVEEDGVGNEIPIFESVDWRYQFDTGFVPDHFAEFIHELALLSQKSITMRDKTATGYLGPSIPNYADHEVPIKRVETDMTPDGDGCYMNVNVQFLINKYNKSTCCTTDICECPQTEAIQAISYTTNQDDAEMNVTVGDTYLVPNNGPAGPNPDWQIHDNEIAVWNGSDWDYTPQVIRDYAYVDDVGSYYVSLGPGDVWEDADAVITNIVEVGGGTCMLTVTGVTIQNTWWKLQIEIAPAVWQDVDGVFYSSDQWLAGQDHYVDTAGNYDFRLFPIDIGECPLIPSDEFNFDTTETCI